MTQVETESSCMETVGKRREVQRFGLVTTRNAAKMLYEWTDMIAVAAGKLLSVDIHIQCMLDYAYGESYKEMKKST